MAHKVLEEYSSLPITQTQTTYRVPQGWWNYLTNTY